MCFFRIFKETVARCHQGRPPGIRKSERQKKPPVRFNKEVGHLAEPSKSTRKKTGEGVKGAKAKPLLISEWFDEQVFRYCEACGISFVDSMRECINQIRSLEETRSRAQMDQAEPSMEARDM